MKHLDYEIKKYDKDFGAFLVILTTETEVWAVKSTPHVFEVTSSDDFISLGIECTTNGEHPFKDLKVGECVKDIEYGGDYEGVYIMRIA